MSNIEIVVRGVMLVVGLCLALFVVLAACTVWRERRDHKRGLLYRDRQLDCLQMLRDDQERADAWRARNIARALRFGSSNQRRASAQEKPAAQPFEEDFGGTMSPRRLGHHDSWED